MAVVKPQLAFGESNIPASVQQAGQLLSPLHLRTTESGRPIDLNSLVFVIQTDPAGAQVFPVAGSAVVNVSTFFPTGHKLARGLYVADFTVPTDGTIVVGTYKIVWTVKRAADSPNVVKTVQFDIVLEKADSLSPGGLFPKPGNYATIDDIRGEGFSDEGRWQDDKITEKIRGASRLIEKWTGRWFEPRLMTFYLGGDGERTLLFPHPIIEIHEIRFETRTAVAVTSSDIVDRGDYVVYNRHITQGLLRPDDRDLAKVSFAAIGASPIIGQSLFPRGRQNIQITGVFGYTDPDPDCAPFGITPQPIKDACRMMVARNLEPIEKFEDREDRQMRFRVTNERTGNRSISLTPDPRMGAWTGDPEIDTILATYVKPIGMRAIGEGRADFSVTPARLVQL